MDTTKLTKLKGGEDERFAFSNIKKSQLSFENANREQEGNLGFIGKIGLSFVIFSLIISLVNIRFTGAVVGAGTYGAFN